MSETHDPKSYLRLVLPVFALLALAVASPSAKAQIRPQNEAVKDFAPGVYVGYRLAKGLYTDKYTGELDPDLFELVGTEPDPTNPEQGVVVKMYTGVTDGELAEGKEEHLSTYMPDKPGFPIYWYANGYMGNEEMRERLGLVPGKETNLGSRLVFHDGLIYYITDWSGPQDFGIWAVLEQVELPKSPIKRVKFGLELKKRLEANDPYETLKAYFAEAVPAQEREYAKWVAQPANAAIVAEQERKRKAYYDEINERNSEYYASEEFARIRENNQMADNAAAASRVTVENTGSSTLYIYEEGSRNGSRLSPGSTGTFTCKKSLYATSSSNSSVNGGGRMFHGAGGCGSRVTVQ